MLIIFFDIKGIVWKEFILLGQTLNSAYYRDILRRLRENVQRLSPRTLATKDVTAAARQRTVSHFIFHQFLTKAT
jgi:hypothetical protein